jgi:allantoate deiminase
VLGAVEAFQTINERGIQTERPLEVVAFTDEEGAHFSFAMVGSRATAGRLVLEDLNNEDREGVSIVEAMCASGLDPGRIGEAARPAGSVHAYVELHIEQGTILESWDLSVGVVTGIAGPVWLRFTLTGEAAHAGTTPMELRRDAMAAAAVIISRIEREAGRTGTSVGTVGQLDLEPGGINIVPGRVSFSLDLRDIDESIRNDVETRIMHEAALLCEQRDRTRNEDAAEAPARALLGSRPERRQGSVRGFGLRALRARQRSRTRRDAPHGAVSYRHDLCPL